MPDLKVYEYVVIKQPLEDDDGKVSEPGSLIVPLTSILASDDKQATLIAGRAIPEEEMVNLDRLTVAVRPF